MSRKEVLKKFNEAKKIASNLLEAIIPEPEQRQDGINWRRLVNELLFQASEHKEVIGDTVDVLQSYNIYINSDQWKAIPETRRQKYRESLVHELYEKAKEWGCILDESEYFEVKFFPTKKCEKGSIQVTIGVGRTRNAKNESKRITQEESKFDPTKTVSVAFGPDDTGHIYDSDETSPQRESFRGVSGYLMILENAKDRKKYEGTEIFPLDILSGERKTIGRLPKDINDVKKPDIGFDCLDNVSRYHATITVNRNILYIEDGYIDSSHRKMSSTYGTAINGESLSEMKQLLDGDKVHLGVQNGNGLLLEFHTGMPPTEKLLDSQLDSEKTIAIGTTAKCTFRDITKGASSEIMMSLRPGEKKTIGRGGASSNHQPDITFSNYPHVSHIHATITYEENRLFLTDGYIDSSGKRIHSTNGTKVDGIPVPTDGKSEVNNGSLIYLGFDHDEGQETGLVLEFNIINQKS